MAKWVIIANIIVDNYKQEFYYTKKKGKCYKPKLKVEMSQRSLNTT